MNLSELQTQLQRFDLTPSRKLGQSFLVDENVSRWIAAHLHAGPEETEIEVGPGFGALTEHLAQFPGRAQPDQRGDHHGAEGGGGPFRR